MKKSKQEKMYLENFDTYIGIGTPPGWNQNVLLIDDENKDIHLEIPITIKQKEQLQKLDLPMQG